ncbi:MAG: Ig-like domain-containing protein, partial [Candidatus Thermoplasmatota archaeon]|nr:Ig-like domain-containing protein [Candidatus Thermoplasmatota archaeon]
INSPLEGQAYTNEDVIVFDGNGSFDPNGDNITYHWVSSLSGDIGYEEHVEELLRVGEHQIWLFVEDTEGVRSGETVNITVVQANRLPIVHITSPIEGQRFEHNEAVELNTSYSFDPDGDTLTFEWGSDLDGYLGNESIVKVLLSEGTHLISVTANDGRGLSSTAVVTITVEPQGNIPPMITLTSPPSNTTVSGVVTVTGTASDPDGGPVTVRYAISMPDNWEDATLAGIAWIFEWDTTALTNGQYSVFVEADDGEHTTRIFVQYFIDNAPPENQPPVVSLDSPEPGKVKGTVSLKGLASDPDGDPITKVEVRFDSGLWQPVTGTSIWTYQWGTLDAPNGPVVVTLRAFDGEDWSEYMTYDFEVANEDTEPTTDTDLTLWVLILVVLVILVIAGWFLYSRRE